MVNDTSRATVSVPNVYIEIQKKKLYALNRLTNNFINIKHWWQQEIQIGGSLRPACFSAHKWDNLSNTFISYEIWNNFNIKQKQLFYWNVFVQCRLFYSMVWNLFIYCLLRFHSMTVQRFMWTLTSVTSSVYDLHWLVDCSSCFIDKHRLVHSKL